MKAFRVSLTICRDIERMLGPEKAQKADDRCRLCHVLGNCHKTPRNKQGFWQLSQDTKRQTNHYARSHCQYVPRIFKTPPAHPIPSLLPPPSPHPPPSHPIPPPPLPIPCQPIRSHQEAFARLAPPASHPLKARLAELEATNLAKLGEDPGGLGRPRAGGGRMEVGAGSEGAFTLRCL